MRVVNFEKAIEKYDNKIFLDFRSEGEFELETIPGAINIPLFNNNERATIGTLYKQKSRDIAVEKGIEIISSRLPNIYKQIYNLAKEDRTMIGFCARGGMRSSTIINLLESLKFNIVKLDSGYKGYRAFVNKRLPEELEQVNFITMYGKTGTGKTNILKKLKEMNYDTLDFEGCANHRGSVLGSVGLKKQNTQKMFESLVLDTLLKRKDNIIFVEGESKRIGNIVMPSVMYDKLENGKKILVEANIDFRIKTIREEYINDMFSKEDLIKKLEWLSKYIKKEMIEDFKNHIQNNDYDYVIENMMVKYYDLTYKSDKDYLKTFYNSNDYNCAKEIIKYFNM